MKIRLNWLNRQKLKIMKQKDPMEFNPYKYVDKENIYPRLDGVLRQGGYKVKQVEKLEEAIELIKQLKTK